MGHQKDQLFNEVIRKRRSVRKFEPGKTVSKDMLKRIVDCGRWAPSGANTQCFDFIVIKDKEMIKFTTNIFLKQAQRLVDFAKGLSLFHGKIFKRARHD